MNHHDVTFQDEALKPGQRMAAHGRTSAGGQADSGKIISLLQSSIAFPVIGEQGSGARMHRPSARQSARVAAFNGLADQTLQFLCTTLGGTGGTFYLLEDFVRYGHWSYNLSDADALRCFEESALFGDHMPRADHENKTCLRVSDFSLLFPADSLNPDCPATGRAVKRLAIELLFRDRLDIIAGATIFLKTSENASSHQLLKAAFALHPYIQYNVSQLFRLHVDIMDRARNSFNLTGKESEVAELLLVGRTNSEISSYLGISISTVKCHIAHIFNKVGVGNRSSLIAALNRP